MFKKTLLALALTGLAGTATAGTVSAGGDAAKTGFKNTAVAISSEGAALVDSATMSAVTFTVDSADYSDYATLKTLVVDISGATLSPGTAAKLTLNTSTPTDLTSGVVTATYPTSTRVVFALKSGQTFPTIGATGASTGDEFTIEGLKLVFNDIDAGSKVSYSVTAQSSVGSTTIDTGSAVVGEFVNQLGLDVAKITKTINVGAARKLFTGTTTAAQTTAQAEFEVDNLATVLTPTLGADNILLPVTAAKYDFTLNGDFSFLDVDADGKIDTDFELNGVVAKDLQSTSFLESSTPSAAFEFETDGSVELPELSFTGDVSFEYGLVDTALSAKKADYTASFGAGSWALNGSGGKINFMPFGSQYAQSITVTNRTSVAGDISVKIGYNGETYSKDLGVKAAAGSITDISKAVAAFAAENGVVGNATVDVNVAAAGTTVDAIYYSKTDKDRVKVAAQ